jgi:homoserine/homoserine lactone efflux protein
MSIELYLTFVAAAVILILIPGPNVSLIVANSIAHGPRYGLITVAGTTSAAVVQLTCVVLGLTGLLSLMATWFERLRWAGVAYLIYLGVMAWRAPPADLAATRAQRKSPRDIYLRGFLVSLTNPKTLLFYAAFLPQFVGPGPNRTAQLIMLAGTFVVIALTLDCVWSLVAPRALRALGIGGRGLNRLTGGLLITAAAGLAWARRP